MEILLPAFVQSRWESEKQQRKSVKSCQALGEFSLLSEPERAGFGGRSQSREKSSHRPGTGLALCPSVSLTCSGMLPFQTGGQQQEQTDDRSECISSSTAVLQKTSQASRRVWEQQQPQHTPSFPEK